MGDCCGKEARTEIEVDCLSSRPPEAHTQEKEEKNFFYSMPKGELLNFEQTLPFCRTDYSYFIKQLEIAESERG